MKISLLLLFAVTTTFTYWLRQINLQHLKQHGATIPDGFSDAISQETLTKTTAYTLDSSRLGLWESLFDNALVVLFLFAGVLPLYDSFISGVSDSFIVQGLLFFLILTWVQTILELPFTLYGTFVVEARHGFNTTTPLLWLTDLLKSQFIGSLFLAIILSASLWLIEWSPLHWWLWVWGVMALFTLVMMFISPYVIEPLFNKFEPVDEPGLTEEISAMMAKAGLKVGRVMKMDASKRSRHSNAYFTGIGKVKRIVLFDTLIQQMTHAEIVAVLAHEIGHWKLRHILKRLIVSEVMLLGGMWCAWQAMQWEGLPGLVGMESGSFFARLIILGFVASLLMFPLTPISAWFSRRHERDADRFASAITGDPESLASALIKMSAENLSNLHPHPLYAGFYYSHPPVVDRVRALRFQRVSPWEGSKQ
ncbi:M48 family metallopeptidase [Geobacter sp. OR-1]|uniref:M48 family metallopeptidase n=1 Tax=Geobacter sp. OR-1 TaxID=1266765 RepID=UPI0005A9E5B1|nr:M48 family metallopeptidase [Geobacter sp. OR-1]